MEINNKRDQKETEKHSNFQKNKINLWKWIIILILFLLVYKAGVYNGKKQSSNVIYGPVPFKQAEVKNKNVKNNQVDFSLFWDAWALLKEKYVDADELDANQMVYDSIKGMLAVTKDPYTIFLDPKENKEFNQEIEGTFEGIGAEVGIKKGILTIIAPLHGSPAEKAGLRAGDKVIKINGQDISNISIDEAVKKMRGPKGTKLELTIFRNDGTEKTRDIVITRGVINVASVREKIKEIDGKKIEYFDISRFGETTAKDFLKLARNISQKNISGIIIDLRNNPGGYLDQAVELASQMLPKEKVVVIEEDGDKKQKRIYSRGGDYLSSYKTVILINKGSASASEILAGALKDNRNNVTLVGETSYGKGSVQELIPMKHNTALKVTVAKWLTPKGKQINKKGIKPDIEIELTEDDFNNDRDPQLDKALELFK